MENSQIGSVNEMDVGEKFSGNSMCVTCRHVENYADIFVTWKQRKNLLASGWRKNKLGKKK